VFPRIRFRAQHREPLSPHATPLLLLPRSGTPRRQPAWRRGQTKPARALTDRAHTMCPAIQINGFEDSLGQACHSAPLIPSRLFSSRLAFMRKLPAVLAISIAAGMVLILSSKSLFWTDGVLRLLQAYTWSALGIGKTSKWNSLSANMTRSPSMRPCVSCAPETRKNPHTPVAEAGQNLASSANANGRSG
jgi:hypothetical protein